MKNINHYSFVIIILLFSFLIHEQYLAQESWEVFQKEISVSQYEGDHFRLQAFIKTDVEDDSASARIRVAVRLKKGYGFHESMYDKPIRNKEWEVYTIEGIIDSGATALEFGPVVQFNGKFYYDLLKIEVETEKDNWETIYSCDFENDFDGLNQGFDGRKNPTFKASIISNEAAEGNKCLLIEGKNVPNYGINNKAGKYADVNGIKLYYEIYGEGHPLLVLHGNGGSIGLSFGYLLPELIKKYKVIAVDSRAQGRSTDTDEELTYKRMASDINSLLEKLNIDSVYICGYSDGAILGLILAMEHPEKVSKLLAFGANIQTDSLAIFPWSIEDVEKTIATTNNPRIRKLNLLMEKYPDIPFSMLSSIKAPVLIMAGDRDVIRPEHTLKLFQNIPNSQLCIIPGATHFAKKEKKELFLQLLEDFFDKPFTMPSTEDYFK